MPLAAKLNRLFANLVHRHRLESSLDEELRSYVEEITQRKIGEGIAPAAARPEPKEGEVRVRVLAAGVSLPDVMAREGIHPETPPCPLRPGGTWSAWWIGSAPVLLESNQAR